MIYKRIIIIIVLFFPLLLLNTFFGISILPVLNRFFLSYVISKLTSISLAKVGIYMISFGRYVIIQFSYTFSLFSGGSFSLFTPIKTICGRLSTI